MSRIGVILVRLFIVLAGYGIAALVASIFLHFIAWPFVAEIGEEAPWLLMGGMLVSIPLIALFASYFSFLPAAVMIVLSEWRGYRSWLYHALSGGAAAFAGVALAQRSRGLPEPRALDAHGELALIAMPEVLAVAIAAGLVGGIAYWLVAGRSAGWRSTAPAPSGS